MSTPRKILPQSCRWLRPRVQCQRPWWYLSWSKYWLHHDAMDNKLPLAKINLLLYQVTGSTLEVAPFFCMSRRDSVTLSLVLAWFSELLRIILRAFRVARSAFVYTEWILHERQAGGDLRITYDGRCRSRTKYIWKSSERPGTRTRSDETLRMIPKGSYRDEGSNCAKTIVKGTSASQ